MVLWLWRGNRKRENLRSETVAAAGVAALQVSPALQPYQQGVRGAFRQSKLESDLREPQAKRLMRQHSQNVERPIHRRRGSCFQSLHVLL